MLALNECYKTCDLHVDFKQWNLDGGRGSSNSENEGSVENFRQLAPIVTPKAPSLKTKGRYTECVSSCLLLGARHVPWHHNRTQRLKCR